MLHAILKIRHFIHTLILYNAEFKNYIVFKVAEMNVAVKCKPSRKIISIVLESSRFPIRLFRFRWGEGGVLRSLWTGVNCPI